MILDDMMYQGLNGKDNERLIRLR